MKHLDSSVEIVRGLKAFSDKLSTDFAKLLQKRSSVIRIAVVHALSTFELKGRILTWEVVFKELNLVSNHTEFVLRNTKVRVNLDITRTVFRASVVSLGDVHQDTIAKMRGKSSGLDKEIVNLSKLLKKEIETAL